MTPRKRPYEVEHYEVWAETPELRMVVLTLAAGQEVPWHWHTNVSDTFFCMAGPMVIETRAPREVVELEPGGNGQIPCVVGKIPWAADHPNSLAPNLRRAKERAAMASAAR